MLLKLENKADEIQKLGINRVMASGMIQGKPTALKSDPAILELQLLTNSGTQVTVYVSADSLEHRQISSGEEVTVVGIFGSRYKRLSYYRSFISIYAMELYRGSVQSYAHLKGSISGKIVYITDAHKHRSVRFMFLIRNEDDSVAELPCVIREEYCHEGLLQNLCNGDRLELAGELNSRIYKKRLGRSRFIEEKMCEVDVVSAVRLSHDTPKSAYME